MAVKIKSGRALGVVNLTSMMDMIFQLLIFFVVATRFEEVDREMDVDLPKASEAKPLIVTPQEIFVNLTHSGDIFMGGQQLSVAQLSDRLAEVVRDNPANQSVILRADKRCNLDAVVQVINVCNKVGVGHSLTTASD
jgi:biopolymer transport protein ExbD